MALLPFLVLCFFAHPGGDDFNYACRSASAGLQENLKADYFHWNGRYISNILVFQNPMHLSGLGLYRLAPLILIIATLLTIKWTVGTFFSNLKSGATWLIAGLTTSIFLSTMPIISEGIYWYTGAYTYHLSCLIALFYGTWLFRFMDKRYFIGKQLDLFGLTLLIFLLCGFCEVTTLILFWSHLIAFFYLFKQKNHSWFVPILLACILGFVVMVFAPGNAVRAAHFTDNHDLSYSLWMTFAQSVRFIITWFANPVFVLGLVCLLVYYEKYRNKYTDRLRISPLLGVSVLVLIMFSCIFPAYWGTGILGQHRTLNVAYFFVIVWVVVAIISLLNEGRISLRKIKNTAFTRWVFPVMLLSLLIAPNYKNAITDWFAGDLHQYDQQMTERYELLETCPEHCELPGITAKPTGLFLYEISDDHKSFVNEGWACFHGKKTVFSKK